jgi:hypothetical protein
MRLLAHPPQPPFVFLCNRVRDDILSYLIYETRQQIVLYNSCHSVTNLPEFSRPTDKRRLN